MMRLFFLFVVLAAGCNRHVATECLPPCTSPAFTHRFEDCVANGSGACEPGNRACCALAAGCRGPLGDQVVDTPSGLVCMDFPAPECLAPCTAEQRRSFADCLAGMQECMPNDAMCCTALHLPCAGTLGNIAISVPPDCCTADVDCPLGEVCDLETQHCVSAACTAACPPGRTCADGRCTCLSGTTPVARCPAGEACDLDGTCGPWSHGSGCATRADCPVGQACVAEMCFPCAEQGFDRGCDGFDDDCDDLVDEDFVPMPTTCGLGICASTGALSCGEAGPIDSCVPGTPMAAEDCELPGDEDCDGLVNEDCGFEVDCVNGADDDMDLATDCEDSDCATHPFCCPTCAGEICDNDIDDDGDFDVDCADIDCMAHPLCSGGSFCGDGVLDVPIETCDDGGAPRDGDGCSFDCQMAPGRRAPARRSATTGGPSAPRSATETTCACRPAIHSATARAAR